MIAALPARTDRRLVGQGSNKQLEPFKATQFDLGLEWYFQPGAVAGVSLFRKNVDNFTCRWCATRPWSSTVKR
jgi:outer membrane receptor protein involved in Fe transport